MYVSKTLIFVILAVVLASITWIVWHVQGVNCLHDYEFLNPSVTCGTSVVIKKTGYADFEFQLEKYLDEEKKSGNLIDASIYFRDLDNGPVWGINEMKNFAPASLLKLPLAMVYLYEAERDPEVLNQEILFDIQRTDVAQVVEPEKTIQLGKRYTVKHLLEKMLRYSDNNSYYALHYNLIKEGKEVLVSDVLLELGVISPKDLNDEVMTVRRYASILRVLYNVSFVNFDLSNKVLGWLSESSYDQGIASGLPEGTVLANKFGERVDPFGFKQLHDCGIVYYPGNPFLLCIMTSGNDYGYLSGVIQHIAKEVYEEVDSRRIKSN